MSDPLSVAASVVGITAPAVHGIRLLIDDLQQLRDAPEVVQRLKDDLWTVNTAITSLQAVEDREWKPLGASIAENSKTTISTCLRSCDLFRADLQRWTRHSRDGKLTGRIERMKAMSEQLQSCKMTISSVVSIAKLYSSVRHSHITEEILNTISMRRNEITRAVVAADDQMVALRNRREELNLDSVDREQAEGTESKAEALQQVEEQCEALNLSRKLLDELLTKSREEAIIKSSTESQSRSNTVTFGSQNSGFQSGIMYGSVSGISFAGK
ncbi:uncharacterized protein BCR38DRAFT_429299 [Pseudomassariella vexata]|uniref:Azaphilone pigments biosynthesis cluster protein L N-terminal domain-containing protein n=1 Tax=Pseudomassariella vexata TaxID=1141098 RepID=A0A1Y2E4A8_9PEZI|nr:uncharacterized protein BCR38DRAFT_429299 [Pseudomassariella vexata]ORY66126.1 hypothetical protein BCR38DRAFT_429299 [Pseudomassariella vexata]